MCTYQEKLSSTLDRFKEARFFIHLLERSYHVSDSFRYSLNSFIRALKEVPQLISMELQNEDGFPAWYRERREALKADPLISHLSEQRDYIVHRGMLRPASFCTVGLSEGRGIKLGIGQEMDPLQNSDDAMLAYLLTVIEAGDMLGILKKDDDAEPCVEREWRLQEFDEDLVALTGRAYLVIGDLLKDVIRWLGEEPPVIELDCLEFPHFYQVKPYDRKKLRKWVKKASKRLPKKGKRKKR